VPPDITAEDRLWAALIYFAAPIGPFFALALPERQARPFIQLHTRPALALGAAITLLVALLYFPTLGLSIILYGVDWYYAYRAYRGEVFAIPVITSFLQRQGW
jgi:uncharacterized membrane protein